MTALVRIHVAKKALGLDDDTYRDLLERETGKRSAKGMTSAEMERVLTVMNGAGAGVAAKTPKRGLEGPYAKKLQALWISGYALGVIRDRRDDALLSWVDRQTGVARTEWLRDPKKGSAAVDALKALLAREGGVDWKARCGNEERIARAQHARLKTIVPVPDFWVAVADVLRRSVLSEKPERTEWHQIIDTWGMRLRADLPSRGDSV